MMDRAELLCPIVVGRDDEQRILDAALDRSVAGTAHAYFLSGEAGIGKSKICQFLIEQAFARGLAPIVGHASSLDAALPYGPIVAALEIACRRLASFDRSALDAVLRPHRGVLAALVPGLAAELDVAAVRGSDPPADATSERRRVFEALESMLFGLAQLRGTSHAAPAPLVLVLEDLQWADDTTLDFIRHLVLLHGRGGVAGDERASGLLLVGTYRVDDVPDGDPGSGSTLLSRVVAALVGQRLAREIRLRPLDAAAHASMLAAILGHPVPVSASNALYLRSDGNPFVTEELLGALAVSGQIEVDAIAQRIVDTPLSLPTSLRAAVLARLDGLSAEDRRVLTIAAVIGREFGFDILQKLSGLPEPELLDILREGVRRHILVEDLIYPSPARPDAEERFRFRHALTRDAIDGELLGRERRLLHRQVAETLEQLLTPEVRTTSQAANLAQHFMQGGAAGRAQPYAVAAAEYALRVGALAEAAEHLDRAALALDEGDPAAVPLLELQGRVRIALLEIPRAMQLLVQARGAAQQAEMRWRAAAIGSEIAFLTWFADPATSDREWSQLLREAERRARAPEPEDETALRLYAAAAMCCGSNDAHTQALAWAERAIGLAGTIGAGAERLLFRAFVGRGMARADIGAFEEGFADLRHAIELGQKYADPHLALAFNVLIMALHECGRDEQAIEVFHESVEFERRSGAVVAPPPVLYAFLALGRWEEGIAVAEAQLAGYGRFGVPTTPQGLAMAGLGHFLLRKGRHLEARMQLDAALERVRHVRDLAWLANTLWGLALCAEARGLAPEARSFYVECIDRWATTEDRGTIAPILLDAVLFAVRTGHLDDAAQWSEALLAVSAQGNPVAHAASLQAHGRLSLARGGVAEAAEHLRRAVQAWERDRPPLRHGTRAPAPRRGAAARQRGCLEAPRG